MASAWGNSWGAFWGNSWGSVGAVVTPPEPTPPAPSPGGVGGAAWRDHYKRKKLPKRKRTLLEELDAALLELRARTPAPEQKKEILRLERFVEIDALNAEITASQIRIQIEFANAIMREMDDEETILLAIH